jgi:NadR type nicotinamide-nucleotide adenylyltransferase
MIRVVVTGSECTGKTTLASALAKHYEAPLASEFVRDFVAKKGSQPELLDIEEIARGQIDVEDSLVAAAPEILILDTDLLSTWIYSHHYYGECPVWVGTVVDERRPDLYLLADIDVPWVADGVQRDRGQCREEMQSLFRDELRSRGFDFVEISGPLADRLEAATTVIDRLSSSASPWKERPDGAGG